MIESDTDRKYIIGEKERETEKERVRRCEKVLSLSFHEPGGGQAKWLSGVCVCVRGLGSN